MKRTFDGFLYNDLLVELARRNPGNLSFARTILQTQQLFQAGLLPTSTIQRLLAQMDAERKIYDAKNLERLPGVKARFEGDPETNDKTVDDAYVFHGDTRDFLTKVLRRNSIDGKGMPLIGTVHFGRKYNNAYWNSVQMTYGDGDGEIFITFVDPTVVGHELFHGVTEKTSGLEYEGQSGALNESFSDVGGVLVYQWKNNITAGKADWLVGPHIFHKSVKGKALRSMIDPGSAYDDDRLGKDPQPKHMKDLYTGWSDNGGVHINSGIPNLAFARFAIEVGGYAFERPFEIWYETNSGENRVGSTASFQDFANKSMENCQKLHPRLKGKLQAAWHEVGIEVAA